MAKKALSKKKKRRRMIRRIILLMLSVAIAAALIYFMPRIKKVMRLANSASALAKSSTADTFKQTGTTIIYDSDGKELCKMMDNKELYYVEYDDIPNNLVNAFVVMEDQDFYSHKGIDYKAIIRAIIANNMSDSIVQGASTITQQLARNVFLNQDVTWERKIEEMFLAQDLEKKYSKEQILEFYLNNIYFGNGYYGVEAAARGYFSKSVSELTMSEQVFIAAIPNNPTRYNPLTNYDNTVERKNLILEKLYENDYINDMYYYSALDTEITLNPESKTVSKNNSVETYARHCATESLMESSGFTFRYNFTSQDEYDAYMDNYDEYYTACQKMLIGGGYSIFTSIDMDLQKMLQDSVDSNLEHYTEMSDEGVYKMQAAATCIDNTTGNVVAIVGSRSQELEGYTLNRAYQSYRQPGSSIKPLIVYTPYLQKGNTPDTIVSDVYDTNGPRNADDSYAGNITLRTAVVYSKNTTAWNIFKELTPRVGTAFLINMGFHKIWMDRDVQATCLGGFTYGVTTEEMAGAYAALANDGKYRKTTCIEQIFNASGRLVYDSSNREITVYDANASRMMVDMMKSVVEYGTGSGYAIDGVTLAGKTGTTTSNKDAWFCGMSAYYTVAVWQGYDYPATIPDIGAGFIFRDFMKNALNNRADVGFKAYSGKTTESETQAETESQTESDSSSESETTTLAEGANRDGDRDASTTGTGAEATGTERTTATKSSQANGTKDSDVTTNAETKANTGGAGSNSETGGNGIEQDATGYSNPWEWSADK